MSNFFRIMVISAAAVARRADAIRRLRQAEFDGIILRDVYDPAACAQLCFGLEEAQNGLVQTAASDQFHGFFPGVNRTSAPPDLTACFPGAPMSHKRLAGLLTNGINLETRVKALLSALDGGCRYVAAPGPGGGTDHMFTTLRAHRSDGCTPSQSDDEQASRHSWRLIMPNIVSDLYSFVLALSQAEAGGELQIFDLRHDGQQFRIADKEASTSHPNIDGVESTKFRLEPGEMIIFNSCRYSYSVTPVTGVKTCWTACSFMAKSRTGEVLCWG